MKKSKICKDCGTELQYSGFSRRLIERGRYKGEYEMTEFFSCPNKCINGGKVNGKSKN